MTKSSFDTAIDQASRHRSSSLFEENRILKDKHQFKKVYKDAKERRKEPPREERKMPVHELFSLEVSRASKAQAEDVKENKISAIEENALLAANQSGAMQPIQADPALTQAVAGAQAVSPVDLQIQELFEKMCGVMSIMSTSGISETTISLTSPQYASSIFYGAQIIITEYSTAPRAFNIQFVAQSQAVALFHRNMKDLMTAFAGSDHAFQVNRIETGYIEPDKPLFHRKEHVEQETT
jgi:hypothetical protein